MGSRSFAIGLLGGVLGAAAAISLLFWSAGSSVLRPYLEPSRQRIDALETDLARIVGEQEAVRTDIADNAEIRQRLDEDLTEVGTRLDRLETSGPESVVPELAPHLSPIWAQIEVLRAELDRLAEEVSGSSVDPDAISAHFEAVELALEEQAGALAGRVAMLEARARIGQGGDARLAAAAILLGDLRHALDSGEGFGDPLERLAVLLDDDSILETQIERIRPHIAGVATLAELQEGLSAMSLARPASGGEQDFVAATLQNLSSLVEIRRRSAESADPVVAARSALMAGDLASAVSILDRVERDDVTAWLERANARLTVQSALDRVGSIVRELLESPSRS